MFAALSKPLAASVLLVSDAPLPKLAPKRKKIGSANN